jgi:hypothetical protein
VNPLGFAPGIPTELNVMVELERAEEAQMVDQLDAETEPEDLATTLTLLVRRVSAAEQRLGPLIFRDMLGLHFSSTRPIEDDVTEHPLLEFVVATIRKAQRAGRVSHDADADELGVFFLTGLFALLATGASTANAEGTMLDRYVNTIVRGMETR